MIKRQSPTKARAAARRLSKVGVYSPPATNQAVVRQSQEPMLSGRRLRLWRRGLAVLLIVMVGALVFVSPLFAVRKIQVSGLSQLTPEEATDVRSQASIPSRTNLFLARAGNLAEALKRLPTVEDARVGRRLPGTLVVTVIPRKPAAVLEAEGGRWEVDDKGIIIRESRASKGLPEVHCACAIEAKPGVSLAGSPAAGALSLLKLANARQPLQIAKIDVDQNADIWLNMRDTVAIRLGQVEDLPKKVAQIRSIYAGRPDIAAEVQSIDLSCPDAPACTPRDASTGSPQDAASRSTRNDRSDHLREVDTVDASQTASRSGPTRTRRR